MKIAMLYASWEKFGEKWCTPSAISNELKSRNHEIEQFNLYHDDGILFRDNVRHYSNQGINRLIQQWNKGYRPDAIFCLDYGPWDALQFDKQIFPGAILVKECGDEPQAFNAHRVAAPRVHVLLSPDLRCVNWYNSNAFNAIWWTHHADTKIFYSRSDIPVLFDCVTTCGSRGNGLTDGIKRALGDQFNNERYFYGEDHAKRLCMGKMVFQCSQYKEITRRIFEGMACGKMVITDRLSPETGLNDLFVDGQDIVYYDNTEDAINKIRYYADHDAEREFIAQNGYKKVIAEHTVVQRVNVFETCIRDIKNEKID